MNRKSAPHDHASWPGEYRYCPHCTASLELRKVAGKRRMACPACDFVHWRNPGVGVAVVIRDDDGRVLLIRRASGATRAGLWAVPAGFVDYGEEIRAAAARELFEETNLRVSVGEPLFVASNFHDPAKLTVGIWFTGTVESGRLQAGDDADEAGYFGLDDLPELAFDTDRALFAMLRLRDRDG